MKNAKVISVSRRTDIPAYYSEWFMNGIKRGYVDSINPFNRKYLSRISLKPEDVICFVFWSKNPKPMIKYLDEIDNLGYSYYFQFTLTPYGTDIEENVPNKNKEVINTFIELSNRIGKEKVIWRYDPILINDKYTVHYHIKYFEELCKRLSPYTNKVVLSFIDIYQKIEKKLKELKIKTFDEVMVNELASQFSQIAKSYQLELATCSEEIDLNKYEIKHNQCIDPNLINSITKSNILLPKDKGQRKVCGCAESIDIGTSNTCKHFCHYCYANYSKKSVIQKTMSYNPNSTILCNNLIGDEEIHWRNGNQ